DKLLQHAADVDVTSADVASLALHDDLPILQVPAGTTILNTVTVAGDKIPDGYYITNTGDQFIEDGVLTVYVRQNAEEVVVKIVDADTDASVADSFIVQVPAGTTILNTVTVA